MFYHNKTVFLLQLVTMDETWVRRFEPEDRGKGKSDIYICNARVVTFNDYLQNEKKIINDQYYGNLLQHLGVEIKEKDLIWRERNCNFITT